MLELIGFHALGNRVGRESEVGSSIERALAEMGVTFKQSSTGLVVGADGQPPVNVSWPAQPTRVEFAVGPIDRATIESWRPAKIASLVKELWNSVGVELGRSFRGGGAGQGIVRESELDGALEFVDWMQYLSPRQAARWPRTVLESAPFYHIEPMSNGGWFLLLGPEPFDGLMSRRAVADHLGIRLPPLIGKDMNGRPIELNWP